MTENYLNTLRFFLSMPLNATPVLEHFAAMPNAQPHNLDAPARQERFVYIPATRQKPVLLVAHADTYTETGCLPELLEKGDTISNADPDEILGADDRAGCAIVAQLGEMQGHGILITDGEEEGQIGAKALMNRCPDIADELQKRYQFMVEFDRRESRNFKCYDVGTDEFRDYVSRKTGFKDAGRRSYTDICVLARAPHSICGVNLATGYYGEHYPGEYLMKSDWLETLKLATAWLGEDNLPKFLR